jgi:anthranilate synthase component 1/salicylate synthetase
MIGSPRDGAAAVIRALERTSRGLYGGAVLTVDYSGELDAALAIRTVFQQNGRSWLRAGAGICPQSVVEREFEETCEKLRSLADAIVVTGR